MRTIKQNSFCSKSDCMKIAKDFREWAELDGVDGYNDTELSVEKCNNIADQFEIAAEKGGAYFSNIITDPFFTAKEVEAILTLL